MRCGLGKIRAVPGQLVYGIRQQAVLDLSDGDIAKVVDEVAPRIVQPADPGDKRDDTADLEPVGEDPPAPDQQRGDDL